MNNNPLINQQNMFQQSQMPQSMMYAPRYEVIKVKGQAGARNIRMAPNSNVLLLDQTAPLVWYAQTDGTGYLTVTPFDVIPHQAQPQVNINDLSERVSKLQEAIANVQQSNFGTKQSVKRKKSNVESSMYTTG